MAIINCPECKTQVSNMAEKCPQCAYPINVANKNNNITVEAKEGCFLQTLNTGCMIIAIIIGFLFIIGLIGAMQ